MPESHKKKLKSALRNGNSRNIILQQRDVRLFKALSILRLLDRGQVSALAGFKSVTRVNSRLLKLLCAGLLRRFFFVSALGGKKAIYCLSKRGASLIGIPPNGLERPPDSFLIGDKFVAHQLAINQVYCAAVSENPSNEKPIENWEAFTKPISQSLRIIPDAYFEINTTEKRRPIFLEVDRGTEGLPVWNKKINEYLQLAASGEFERIFRRQRFAVLVVALSERRLQSIKSEIRKRTSKLFFLATLQNIRSQGFFSRIWMRPEGEQPQSLT